MPSANVKDLEAALQALEAGQWEAAEARLRAIAAEDPSPIGGLAWAYLGRIHMLRFQMEEARLAFERALQQAPDHFVVRLERGVFFLRLGFYPDAIAELEAALQRAPAGPAREHAYRLLQRAWERGRGSFVRRAVLPDVIGWLRSLRRGRGGKCACSSSSS